MKAIWGWVAIAVLILVNKASDRITPAGAWTANFSPGEFIPPGDINTISKGAEDSLKAIAVNVLQPARNQFGLPIRVTSAYRNPQRNADIGGVPTSQHIYGQAVDITPIPATKENFKKLWDILVQNGKYDQIIWERALAFTGTPSHLHLSWVVPGLNPGSPYQTNRKRKLQYYNGIYTTI